jgi:general secretion pathway protein F
MPHFIYRAVSPAGQISQGDMVAASEREVVASLQAGGHIPLKVEADDHPRLRSLWPSRSAAALAAFVGELSVLLHAGLPLDRALEILGEVARRPADAMAPRALLAKIQGGASLADAMADDPWFSEFCVSMVRAGELSGALDGVLDRLAGFLKVSAETRAKMRSAMTYPAIVLAVCVASLVGLFTFVIPRFRPFFEDAHVDLPLTTRALLAVGDLFQHDWWLILAVPTALAAAAVHLSRSPPARARRDALLLGLPAIGDIVRTTETAHFCRVLGTLLKNGVPLTQGIRISSDTIGNRAMRHAIAGIGARVKEGKGLTAPLAETSAFPPLALCLIRVGEEAARLDDMLLEVAAIYDTETAHSIERLLALLGPLLTVGLGLLVAFVIGSIMLAILSAYQLAI